jgi:hypothetical protein
MATIAYLTQIEFDLGIISKLGDIVSSQGIQNPMLVVASAEGKSEYAR